jgi:microcompartment protein CcmK/EutM
MLLGRVIGDVVSTIKEPCLDGRKVLWVQPLGLDNRPYGNAVLSLDVIGAGPGETVLVLEEGSGAQEVCKVKGPSPIGSAIVAIVDSVKVHEEPK